MLPSGLLKEYSRWISLLLRMLDMGAVVLAGAIAYYARFGNMQFPIHYCVALCTSAVLTIVVFQLFHVYQSMRATNLFRYIVNVFQAALMVLFLLASAAFMTKTGEMFSRSWFFTWAVSMFILLALFRGGLLIVLRLMRAHGWNEKRVVIIGAGPLGYQLTQAMHQALWTGFRIITLLDDAPPRVSTLSAYSVPVLKMPDNLSAFVASHKPDIDEVWIALPLSAEKRVRDIVHALRHHSIPIRLVLDVFGIGLLRNTMTEIDGFPMLNLNATPLIGANRILKAVEDRLFAAIILVCISPLFLLIAVGVKLSSKGPVFFKQLRHGCDGKVIKVYKFRTMIEHQERGILTQATLNDARVTRFGRFLRRTSLDELPQFINVLQGRMSIVGPRPHALSHNEFYKESIKAYMQRHRVKPGITGWAQINGWRGETDTLDKMQKRIEYDLFYIENWSLTFDLKIIFLTFFHGFTGNRAY